MKSIHRKTKRIRRNITLLSILAALIFGFAFVANLKIRVQAKDVSSNFQVTEAHIFKDSAEQQEANAENGVYSGTGAEFLIRLKWKYESSEPIAAGDTVSFALANNSISKTTRSFTVPNTGAQSIVDNEGKQIGTWKITSKKVQITFGDASVGRTSLEGEFVTARNIYAGSVWKDDMIVPVTVGNLTLQLLILGKTSAGELSNDARTLISSKSDSYVNYSFWTPGITLNELYMGEGAVALSSKAKLSNLIMENTLSENATSVSISSIAARTSVPNYWTSGSGGGSGFSNSVSLLSYFSKRSQEPGQSYEDFKANLNELEYGIYTDENTGRMTVVINFGSQPSTITYSDILKTTGSKYSSMGAQYLANTPFATTDVGDEIDKLVMNNNVLNGAVVQFAIGVTENLPQVSINTPISNTAIFSYDNADNEHIVKQNTVNTELVVGGSISTIKGEAKLYLRDVATKLPISGASFKLQTLKNGSWQDVAGSEGVTEADGSIQALSLDAEESYRWVQTNYTDHYLSDSFKIYSDEAMNTPITDFVMPKDSGVVSYATNERESFKITYKAGEHGNFSDIVYDNQYYGSVTPQPTVDQIVGQNGWTFTGWDQNVSATVVENVTYTAQWQRQTKEESVSIVWNDSDNPNNTRPNSVRVQLLQNGNNYGDAVTISANERWAYAWSSLPVYNDNGTQKYTYSIKNLDTVPGYTTTVGTAANGTFVVTNDIQQVNLTVNHHLKGTAEPVSTTKKDTLDYGSPYSLTALTLANYEYSSVTGSTSGKLTKDTTVTFYYTRKTGKLTVHHYIKGTANTVAPDEETVENYGDNYNTSYKTNLTNYEYDSVSGTASGVFSGDTVVIYYYRLRKGTVTTHYRIKDTNTPIAADTKQTVEYTKTYTTSPLTEIPAAYANYELVSDKPAGYTGTMSSPSVEVTYFYQKKDPALSSSVSVSAPETVANKVAPVSYEINYTAEIADYIGSVEVTLVDKLPYPIDEDESELDDGDYNEDDLTLTWVTTTTCNTYTGCDKVELTHNISLVYVGAAARDLLVNTAEATVKLDSKDNDAATSAETEVRTPSKIIFRYTDIDGNEIEEEIEDDGIVGDVSDRRPPEIPGYTLVADFDGDLTFEEDVRIVTYHYVKNPEPQAPKTGDNIFAAVALGVFASLGAGVVLIQKRR